MSARQRRRPARIAKRLAARAEATARRCKVPPSDWAQLPRKVRKALRRKANKRGRRG